MSVLMQFLEHFNFNRARMGRELGVSRNTASEMVKRRRIEDPTKWVPIMKALPHVTVEQIFKEFVLEPMNKEAAKPRKPKTKTKNTH